MREGEDIHASDDGSAPLSADVATMSKSERLIRQQPLNPFVRPVISVITTKDQYGK